MKFSLLFLISAISLATATLPAQAANYGSTNGTTIVDPSEISSSNLTQSPRNAVHYSTEMSCKGTIALDRTTLAGGGVALRTA